MKLINNEYKCFSLHSTIFNYNKEWFLQIKNKIDLDFLF